jgi:hypothetical protein
MSRFFRIHPAIGVARVGNCPSEFYLAPESAGGLPIACDEKGEPVMEGGAPKYVVEFKDKQGRIKRQAARFRILEYDSKHPGAPGKEVRPGKGGIASVEWTVHLANKKPAWWNFSEQAGDLAYGDWNSYEKQVNNPKLKGTAWAVALRNATVKNPKKRQELIIDPGPRTVSGKQRTAAFDKNTKYSHVSFPPLNIAPDTITTLGNLIMDSHGRLLVLGGHGHAGGKTQLTTFAGGDDWYDDISDGPVNAKIHLDGGGSAEADQAWVMVGSPKFAPELVNQVTLDDLIYDASIREMNFNPKIYRKGKWQRDYRPNYERDIKPILERPAGYRWVATIPFMSSFSPPPFDATDSSEANRANRERYVSYFRKPVPPQPFPNEAAAESALQIPGGPESAFGGDPVTGLQVPLMPVNAGSNPLSPALILKFLTVTPTQYFFLEQWAAGKFDVNGDAAPAEPSVTADDHGAVANCVGGPLCPGIETTWIMQNAPIYSSPYRIKPAHPESYYDKHGLSPEADEGRGKGCEPGDLTKRMAIPWQADFFDCSIQYVNFTDPDKNKDSSATPAPIPPTMFVYWWPPQSPEFVMVDAVTANDQFITGVSVGMQAPYARGINSFSQMILAWSYLGFVANKNRADPMFPYFVEQERNDDQFAVGVTGLGDVNVMGGNYSTNPAGTYVPFWYLLGASYDTKKK